MGNLPLHKCANLNVLLMARAAKTVRNLIILILFVGQNNARKEVGQTIKIHVRIIGGPIPKVY